MSTRTLELTSIRSSSLTRSLSPPAKKTNIPFSICQHFSTSISIPLLLLNQNLRFYFLQQSQALPIPGGREPMELWKERGAGASGVDKAVRRRELKKKKKICG